ncbi:MAG: hypothetical protein QXF12_04995 [Candidatus Aenigmatarchaeota archaeon]
MNGAEDKDKDKKEQQYETKLQEDKFNPYYTLGRHLTEKYGAQETSLILEYIEAQKRLQRKSR